MAEIRADLVGDSRSLVKSVDDVGKALDDVVDELEDTQKEGDTTERDLEANFRAIARASKDTGGDVGRSMDDGFDKAKQGADDFKDEAGGTAREVAASFDGSAESIAGGFQELAANAFAGFGPAGAVAGLAAAAGIGLAVAGFQAVAEAQALSEEAVADWATAYIEAGGKALTAGVKAAKFQEILTDPEKYKTASTNAKNWGVEVETAIAAMSGDKGAITDVTNALKLQGDEAEIAGDKARQLTEDSGGQLLVLTQQEQAYIDGRTALAKLNGEMDAGADRAELLSDYYKQLIDDADGATVQVDELGNQLYKLPSGEEILIEADTGQATTDISTFKGNVDTATKPVTQSVKVVVDDKAWRDWQPVMKNGRVEAYVMGTGRQVI